MSDHEHPRAARRTQDPVRAISARNSGSSATDPHEPVPDRLTSLLDRLEQERAAAAKRQEMTRSTALKTALLAELPSLRAFAVS